MNQINNQCNPYKHDRHSIRLKEYDYSQEGWYFITICVRNRDCILSKINDRLVSMTDKGKIVERCWLQIPHHFKRLDLDIYVIMPNHLHGIIIINGDHTGGRDVDVGTGDAGACRGMVGTKYRGAIDVCGDGVGVCGGEDGVRGGEVGICRGEVTSLHKMPIQLPKPSPTLGKIIAYFKYQSTKFVNQLHNTPAIKLWQRNYYEHIIRNEWDLNRIRNYIRNNPAQWCDNEDNSTDLK